MFDTITPRGFEPRAIAIAARTIGSCYQMNFGPDSRPLVGLAIFSVTPSDDGYDFATAARALGDGEDPGTLVEWLEERIPHKGAIVSWDHWRSLPSRLTTLADAHHHPRVRTAAADTQGRWRDLPRLTTWHLRHAVANAVPCLCITGDPQPCRPDIPASLLPDPIITERTLIDEAMRGWATWARLFPHSDDARHRHPAHQALAAARNWAAAHIASAS